MSLYSRLKTDNARIISGDDMEDLTVYNSSSESLEIKARVTAVGMGINMQGQPVASKKYSVAFHLDEVSTIMSAGETFEGWQASFVNSQGETVRGVLNNQFVDKTLNYLVATLTNIKVGS